MGGCQNYGPFLGPYYNTAPIIWGTQKGTLILTTTHMKALSLLTCLVQKPWFSPQPQDCDDETATHAHGPRCRTRRSPLLGDVAELVDHQDTDDEQSLPPRRPWIHSHLPSLLSPAKHHQPKSHRSRCFFFMSSRFIFFTYSIPWLKQGLTLHA